MATRFLPRAKRQAVEAVYGVFRAADDIADEPGLHRDERLHALDAVAVTLTHIRDGETASGAPWYRAVRAAFARFPIPVADALRLIAACRADVDGVTCETLADLDAYASNVAGTVGRCAMAILGAADADSLARADRLGVALQLTNILRDVERDGTRGRNYLPRALASLPDRGASLVAERARACYAEAAVLERRLPNDGSRLAVALAADLYEATLDGPLGARERARRVVRCMLRCARN